MANKWFKHFNDTLIGDTMQAILGSGRNGDKAVVLFFYILETLSRHHVDAELSLDIQQTARRLHTNCARIVDCLNTLSTHCDALLITYPTASEHCAKSHCLISLSNWSELQTSGDKIKTKNKTKIKIKTKNSGEAHSSPPPKIISETEKMKADDEELREKCRRFAGTYVDAYQARYRSRPDLSGRRIGQIKTLVKTCENFEELCELVQIFCQMDDDWFKKKSHDIQTFAENLGKVRVAKIHGDNFGTVDNGLSLDRWAAEKQLEQEKLLGAGE